MLDLDGILCDLICKKPAAARDFPFSMVLKEAVKTKDNCVIDLDGV